MHPNKTLQKLTVFACSFAKKVVAAALSSYGKWEDTDDHLDFEGELPAPNSFCRRLFSLCSSRATQIEAEVMYSSRCPFVLKSLL